MTDKEITNLEDSIRQRLLNFARAENIDFQLVLVRYANERFLHRLSLSPYKDRFILKGATLLAVWFEVPGRQTRDVDLLAYESIDPDKLVEMFKTVSSIVVVDGLRFDTGSTRHEEIREDEVYVGSRIRFEVYLGKARIPLQFDVAFGDGLFLKPETILIPSLLDQPAPELAIYPVEAVIAEKFEAMVKLGISNSRMKDFWDLDLLLRNMEFDLADVRDSLRATFSARQTTIPETLPFALTDDFSSDDQKAGQWVAFVRKNGLDGSRSLNDVVDSLAVFFEPILRSLAMENDSDLRWKNGSWE